MMLPELDGIWAISDLGASLHRRERCFQPPEPRGDARDSSETTLGQPFWPRRANSIITVLYEVPECRLEMEVEMKHVADLTTIIAKCI